MDTPGLADVGIIAKAASEINQAFTQTGRYHLLFFIKIASGRVDKDDLATIDHAMSSIAMADVPFSIIINMIKKRQHKILMQYGSEYQQMKASLDQCRFKTNNILPVPEIKELEEERNRITRLPEHVVSFIHESPSVTIDPAAVYAIEIERFLREQEKLWPKQLEIERLQREQQEIWQRQAEMEQHAQALQREKERSSGDDNNSRRLRNKLNGVWRQRDGKQNSELRSNSV